MLLKKLLSKNLGDCDLKTGNNITTVKPILLGQDHDFGNRSINGYGMHFWANDPNCACAAVQPLGDFALDPSYGVTGTNYLNGQIRSAYPVPLNRSGLLDSFSSHKRNVSRSDGVGILLQEEARFSCIHLAEFPSFNILVKGTSDIHGH